MVGGDKNKDNLRTKRKSGGLKDKGEDNRRTKLKSASSRRENAVVNPHIPRPRKKGPLRISDAALSTVAPEPQPHPESQDAGHEPQIHPESQDVEPQPQPAGDAEPETTGAPREPATVVEEMEVEQAMLDGEAKGADPNPRNVWQDPYEGLPVPDVFPGEP
ncbi:hypothetical protein QL285_026840 [Trifolium repens]|nr:hypothetical protein QL285_026840 [Trifolium repens]